MSRISSPLHIIAKLRSIYSGTYHLEIWAEPLHPGEDARLLFREVKRLIGGPTNWVYIDEDIDFELSRVSEFGQLRLSVYDRDGRPVSVNSVNLILLSMGISDITPTAGLTERIVILEPTPNHLIQNGKVIVSGWVKPSQKSMLIELVTTDGSVVGYHDVFPIPSPDGSYVPFSAEVSYQVSSSIWVRLQVSESGTHIPGIEHLSSVEVYLSP